MFYCMPDRVLFHLLLALLCLTNLVKAYHEWLIEIAGPEYFAKEFARHNGLIYVDEMKGMPYHYIFHSTSPNPFGKNKSRVKRDALVSRIIPQKELIRKKRNIFMSWNDPYYSQMWYLEYDMNVLEAWELGFSGKGVVVTIMDDGVDYTHDDLKQNYDKSASSDINGRDDDPMPDIKNSLNHHGTRCAGQVAASGNNSACIVGVAYEASIGGIRMLDGKITDRVEAEALMYNLPHIDIYSGSWGPDDSGENHEGPGQLASFAFNTAITTGRNGLGAIFIWASGNGGNSGDSCAFDGYASNIYTISISSVSEANTRPWYQERCTSILATTYSSGNTGQKQVASIDLLNQCTLAHTGTSASAPLAAGFVALLLQANPELTWRDVQYIIVLTSITKPFKDGKFQTNGAGREYSMFYGFGLMDAGKMVRLGKLWSRLPDRHKKLEGKFDFQIPFRFDGCTSGDTEEKGERIRFVEHIELYLNLEYSFRGMLRIQLISPSGTAAEIMPTRVKDSHNGDAGFQKIPLTTVQFWGEAVNGIWNIRIDNQNYCQEIDDGYVNIHLKPECLKIRSNQNKQYGTLNSTWIVAHGTEDFPIRLKKPPTQGKFVPPKEWFSKFEKYVIDNDNSSNNPKFECDPECNPYGGCDELNNCLGGCRNYVLQNGTCVGKCPNGTSGIMTTTSSIILNKKGGKRERLCENCHVTCKTCFRPNSEMDCLSCHPKTYLIPLISNSQKNTQNNISSHLKIPDFMGTCRSTCPMHYYKDESSLRCLKCAKNCQICNGPGFTNCLKCSTGFVKSLFSCTDQIDHKCSLGTQYSNGQCIKCSDLKVTNNSPASDQITTTPSTKPDEISHQTLSTLHPLIPAHEEAEEVRECAIDFCLPGNKCAWCNLNSNETMYMFNGKCYKKSCPRGSHIYKRLKTSWSFDLLPISSGPVKNQIWLCHQCPPGCINCQPRRFMENQNNLHANNQLEYSPLCQECDINLELVTNEASRNTYITSLTNNDQNQPSCLSKCPNGHFNESIPIAVNSLVKNECGTTCSTECKTCNLSPEHCLTCKDTTRHVLAPKEKPYLHYYCVRRESCPPGFYLPSVLSTTTTNHNSHLHSSSVTKKNNMMCVPCPPGCRTCNSNPIGGCESCYDGFILHKNGACLLKTYCGIAQFYESSLDKCISCHSSCESCIGPSMNDCNSCRRSSDTKDDSCLWISQDNSANFITVDDNNNVNNELAEKLPSLQGPTTGLCIKCCPLDYLLSREPPRDCFFCMANQITCISYEYMMKNISQHRPDDLETSLDFDNSHNLEDETSNGYNNMSNIYDNQDGDGRPWSLWQWITAKASRLVLVALCLGLGLSSLIFVSFHFYMLRKCCKCPKNGIFLVSNRGQIHAKNEQLNQVDNVELNNNNNGGGISLFAKLSKNFISCFACIKLSNNIKKNIKDPTTTTTTSTTNRDIIREEDETSHPLRQNLSFNNNISVHKISSSSKPQNSHKILKYLNKRPFSYHEKEFNPIERLLSSRLTADDHSSSQPLPNVNNKQKLPSAIQNFHNQKSTTPSTPQTSTPTSGSSYSPVATNKNTNYINNNNEKTPELFIDRRSRKYNAKSFRNPAKRSPHQESLAGVSRDLPKNLISPLSKPDNNNIDLVINNSYRPSPSTASSSSNARNQKHFKTSRNYQQKHNKDTKSNCDNITTRNLAFAKH